MKKLLAIIVLSLSFITPSQADDISDFQIEGMSIGDSLLNFYDRETIKKNYQNYYKDNEFSTFELRFGFKSKIYDFLQVIYKTKDKKYVIYSISGAIDCPNDFTICKKAWGKILPDLTELFQDNSNMIDKGTYSHPGDKSGKSKKSQINFEFKSGDRATIEMVNWSKKVSYLDNLRINIDTKEFITWLNTKAYK